MAEDDTSESARESARECDWVEELLRAHRARPVRDDGFVERLLTELPARRRSRRGWITPLMTCAGTILAVLSLGGPADALSVLQHTEVAGFIPLGLLLSLVAVLISSLWAISEFQVSATPGHAPDGPARQGRDVNTRRDPGADAAWRARKPS